MIGCNISPVGALTDCINRAGGFSQAYGLALSETGSHLYVAAGDGQVHKCTVDIGSGALTGCASATSSFVEGFGAFYGLCVRGLHLYVAGYGNNNAYVCDITAGTGELDNCRVTAIGFSFNSPVGMFVSRTGHAYVTGKNSNMQICDVNAVTGDLGNCTGT